MKLLFAHSCVIILIVSVILLQGADSQDEWWRNFDLRYWRCVLKRGDQCPDDEIRFYLYKHETGARRKQINMHDPNSLYKTGWDPNRKNVIIIHGFNGSETKEPSTLLRNAYLSREDYNIFMVDYEMITKFPCYFSSLANSRNVAMCSAQLYSWLTWAGATAESITCIGHSLGAHICGMMTNYLTLPQHRIIGLDPARPVINKYADKYFRLTKDDALVVQTIQTNAAIFGESDAVGHVDFCVNGGLFQSGCQGNKIQRSRCSHFQSACYFAQSVQYGGAAFMARPCTRSCPKRLRNMGFLPGMSIPMGEDAPDDARGTFCLNIDKRRQCLYPN